MGGYQRFKPGKAEAGLTVALGPRGSVEPFNVRGEGNLAVHINPKGARASCGHRPVRLGNHKALRINDLVEQSTPLPKR